jgi:methylenetetrahydrofolate dehydrogenase (NADP+)/methenyltetrahydrofolate cyclohydrolase
MTATILDGAALAKVIRGEVAVGVAELVAAGKRRPGLAAVLVGDDPASHIYVQSKVKACEEVGLESRLITPQSSIGEEELLAIVDELNADGAMDGILVQLPLPKGLPERLIVDRIDPDKDVDGFHPASVGRLWLDLPGFVSATPYGILQLLKRSGLEIAGKRAAVVGRSATVGKPMAALLLKENATVTLCHSRTPDLAAVTREADIVVVAVGRSAMIGAEHIKEGAVVVDVGINRISDPAEVERLFPGDEKRRKALAARGSVVVGDVDFTAVAKKAAAITPVPGGVGPLTVAMLLVNTLKAARRRQGLPD